MNLQPLHDYIIIKPIEEVTKSGIVLPESAEKEKPEKGEIIAIGPGKDLDNGQRAPMSVKVGDKILFKKYSADEIKIDKEEYLIINESDVIAIIK